MRLPHRYDTFIHTSGKGYTIPYLIPHPHSSKNKTETVLTHAPGINTCYLIVAKVMQCMLYSIFHA